MNDFVENQDQEEIETPEDQEEELETEDQEAGEELDDDDSEADDSEDDDEEGEVVYVKHTIDGVEYEIPEGVAKNVMLHADYTQKTQTLAEQAKQIEAEKEQAAKLVQQSQEELNTQIKLYSVQEQLKAYEGVNWQQLELEQPESYQGYFRDYITLQNQVKDLGGEIEKQTSERTAKAANEQAKRTQQVNEWIALNIPGGNETLNQIESYLVEIGEDMEAFTRNITPQKMQMARDAWLGSQAAKKGGKPQPKKKVIKPLSKVGAKSSGTTRKNPDKMSFEEYEAARKSGKLR